MKTKEFVQFGLLFFRRLNRQSEYPNFHKVSKFGSRALPAALSIRAAAQSVRYLFLAYFLSCLSDL
ncbi:MAG: hypothetical protein IK053_02000 [Muribaculaceae bacterium]|nr:hypothetical protein [Muribaculaceae bacterium]